MSFDSIFEQKLINLKDTQDSIVSLSKWVLNENKPKEASVIWSTHLKKSTNKLNCLYLVNDIIQHAKKFKKSEFLNEFKNVLPSSLKVSYVEANSTVKAKIARLLKLWEDRGIYTSNDIQQFAKSLTETEDLYSELKQVNQLYLQLNQLKSISKSNLTQFTIQTKSDNILEKKIPIIDRLGSTSIKNIQDIKSVKIQIRNQLHALMKSIDDSIKDDENNIELINSKLDAIHNTNNDDDEDDDLPMYEQDDEDDDSDNENKPLKKPKVEVEPQSDVMNILSKLA